LVKQPLIHGHGPHRIDDRAESGGAVVAWADLDTLGQLRRRQIQRLQLS
jgi:hypothetical protein